MKTKIVFKSGAIVDCNLDVIEKERNGYDGTIRKIKWANSSTGLGLDYLDLADISGIFVEQEENK